MRYTFTVTNRNPETIANKLAAKLGRKPTDAELRAEVARILFDRDEQTARTLESLRYRK